VRFGLGTIFNVVLWQFVGKELGTWGGIEREFRIAMVGGCVGAAALVCLVPIFWRGDSWQAPLAFVLVPLPVLSLFMAVLFAVK